MDKLIKKPELLPDKIDKLQEFVLIGKQKLIACKANLKAIKDVNLGIGIYDQKLHETQDLAGVVLMAEAKMGELLKNIETSHGGSIDKKKGGSKKSLPQGITYKQSHYAQELSKNIDVIDEVIEKAVENKEVPRRSDVIREIQKNKRLKNQEETIIPEGKYKIIYADPPWQYSNTGFEQAAELQYPTMPIEEICKLPVQDILIDKAVLFLWVTNAFISEGLQVCNSWGFNYKTNFAWIKNSGPSIGWFTKSRHELLFIATKGEGMHPKEKHISWFEHKTSKHSKKPIQIYEMIESMYSGPYIELFARNKRDGWKSWGNELE